MKLHLQEVFLLLLGRAEILILISFGVVGLSSLITLLTWETTSFLDPFMHGIVSLASWVLAFAFGCLLFWKIAIRMSINKAE